MKNLKTLFVALVTTSSDKSDILAQIKEQNPAAKSAAFKAECDAAMVRALAAKYGFKYGQAESNAVFSGLAIKSPGKDMDETTKRRFGAARKALHLGRQMFSKQEHAAASLSDKQHAEAKRLAKFTEAQFKRIVELRKQYIAKAAQ